MSDKLVSVFIDYENVNKIELIEEIFSYLKKKNYVSHTRKIIMSKLSNVEALTNVVKENYLDVVISYKRLRTNVKNESSKYENKNNADFRFYIEVMKSLYEDDPDGFVFASGDKDYTELVLELKKQGKYLIGIGNRKNTSEKYIDLFDEFIFCEDLQKQIDLKKEKEEELKEKLRLEIEKELEQERLKKEKEQKKLLEEKAREEKLRKKEENKKLQEAQKKAKEDEQKALLNMFKPLVEEYLNTHKPGKHLLSTITSEIKNLHKDKFPKRVPSNIYVELGFNVEYADGDKSKAYIEIPNKEDN